MRAISNQKGPAPIAPQKPFKQLVLAGCSTSCFALAYIIWEELVDHHATTGYHRKPLSIPRLAALMAPLGYSEATVKRAKRKLLEVGIIERVQGNSNRSTDLIGMPAIFGHDPLTKPGTVNSDSATTKSPASKDRTVVSFPGHSGRPRSTALPCPTGPDEAGEGPKRTSRYRTPSEAQLEQWEAMKQSLKGALEADGYVALIEPLTLDSVRGDEAVVVSAPNDLVLDWALSEHRSLIVRACEEAGLPGGVEARGTAPHGASSKHKAEARDKPALPRLRQVLPSQMAETLRQVEEYVEKKRPTESVETIFRWIVFQLVYLPCSNRNKFRYESGLKGLMGMLYRGEYRCPKWYDPAAVDEHWKAAVKFIDRVKEGPSKTDRGAGQK